MALTRDQFDALVTEIQKKYKANSALYQRNVILLALLGYAYIAIVLLIPITVTVFFILLLINGLIILAIPIGFALGVSLYISLRPLWIKLYPPAGIILKTEEAPYLFETIQGFTKKLNAPKIHTVILNDEFRAGILKIPRWGLFIGEKNYLILGMPLLQALNPEQFKSILAHEFNHLSKTKNIKSSNWIYYLREIWMQLFYVLERHKYRTEFLFKKFFFWYAPYFSAYSFMLARMNEYEADLCSAQIFGADVTADALVSLQIKNRYLQEKYWPDLSKKANHEPTPNFFPIRDMATTFRNELTIHQSQTWLDAALKIRTDINDTHPCLADRLSALGKFHPRIPLSVTETAAEYFFGRNMNQLINRLDKVWHSQVENSWKQRHQYAKDIKQKLELLDKKALSQTLSLDEQCNRASWIEVLNNTDQALCAYKIILEQDMNNVAANYAMGRILLTKNDAAGIEYIEKAMHLEIKTIIPGYNLLYEFMYRHGHLREAREYEDQAIKQWKLEESAKQERERFQLDDIFMTADLSETEINKLSEQLKNHLALAQAYLVRKEVKYIPQRKLYVLGIKTRFGYSSKKAVAQLVDQILRDTTLPKETSILRLDGINDAFLKKIRFVKGAEIYNAKK